MWIDDSLPLSLAAYERACIARALRVAQENPAKAGELLGLSKSTIYRRMRALGIPPPTKRPAAPVSPF